MALVHAPESGLCVSTHTVVPSGRLYLAPGQEDSELSCDNGYNPTQTIEGEVRAGADSVHWTAAFPERLAYTGIIHIINGLGASQESSNALQSAAAQTGYAVVTHGPARRDGKDLAHTLQNPQDLHVEALLAVAKDLRTSSSLHNVPNTKDIDLDQQILLPHSMGSLTATLYALETPHAIEAIINLAGVGYNPGAFINPGSAMSMSKVIIPSVWCELVPGALKQGISHNFKLLTGTLKHVAADPLRFSSEMFSCLRADVRPQAARLRAIGIMIAYLAFEWDTIIRADQTIANHVTSYRVMPRAGHWAPQAQSTKVMREVVSLHNIITPI